MSGSSKWDRFEAAVERLHDDFEFRDLVVYNYTKSLDDSGRATWTEDAGTVIEGEVRERRAPAFARTSGGEESEADVDIWVRADTGATITPVGTDDARPTEIEDSLTGIRYRVHEVFDENNGLLRLAAVEA